MTNIEYVETIDSTNEELKRRVKDGFKSNVCLVADRQTAGKGRNGRTFYSPGGAVGIYMSYLYFTEKQISDAIAVTTAASVITARAIRNITKADARIKWVNDIYLNGRKVSGILTELINIGNKNAIVVGIGINVSTEEFPDEITNIAGAIVKKDNLGEARTRIIEAIVEGFDEYVKEESINPYIQEYKDLSCVIGKKIVYSDWNGKYNAKALEITDNGHLVVELETGETKSLDSGEISLRVED